MIDVKSISTHCTRTEFVGTTVLDTIGLVISGIDDTLLKEMNVGMKYHALGLFSSRTGAAGQITAIDDAVKATNTEVLSIEFPRDTKGWGGHGNYIVIGGNDVSDVRHAIELGLELTKKNAGELYISESGHLEFTYSASAAPMPAWLIAPALRSFLTSSCKVSMSSYFKIGVTSSHFSASHPAMLTSFWNFHSLPCASHADQVL